MFSGNLGEDMNIAVSVFRLPIVTNSYLPHVSGLITGQYLALAEVNIHVPTCLNVKCFIISILSR